MIVRLLRQLMYPLLKDPCGDLIRVSNNSSDDYVSFPGQGSVTLLFGLLELIGSMIPRVSCRASGVSVPDLWLWCSFVLLLLCSCSDLLVLTI